MNALDSCPWAVTEMDSCTDRVTIYGPFITKKEADRFMLNRLNNLSVVRRQSFVLSTHLMVVPGVDDLAA
jgi:hypothetical protein